MEMANSNTDARNGTNVNDPRPTTQLKTHHPNATAAATPPTHPTVTGHAIVYQKWS